MDVAPLDLERLVGLPVHRVLVRGHASAGLHGQEAVPHAEVEVGQEEQGDDTRATEVLLENVLARSGSYSMPTARAPNGGFAAVMAIRPSPAPRSSTRSCGVTCATPSMARTTASNVGTHGTSFPARPHAAE